MMFNLWDPARIADDEVRFDVTRANMPRVGTGDYEWVAACLDAIGVSAPAREWSIEAARCHFYSDYADEPEWRDRWPDTWIVHVKLDGTAPEDFGPPQAVPRLIDRYDQTWNYAHVDPDHDRVALLLMFWRGAEQKAEAIRGKLLTFLPTELNERIVRIERAGADWTRLRIVATRSLFPDHVEALEAFLRRCREYGLVVNRNEMYEG